MLNFHQICILRSSRLALEIEVIDLDSQGHLPISIRIPFQETAINVAPVYTSLGVWLLVHAEIKVKS